MTVLSMVMLACSAILFQPEWLSRSGWSFRIDPVDARKCLLVGEDLGQVWVKLTLVNRSSEIRNYVPFQQARVGGILTMDATQKRKPLSRVAPMPFLAPPRWGRPALGPGEMSASAFRLSHFGYKCLETAGEIEVKATLETDQGLVTSVPFRIDVVEVPLQAIKVSKRVPLTERATRTDGSEPLVVLQLMDVCDERWLVYRRFYGPKYGGGVEYTERLAPARGVADFQLEGRFGDDEPLKVTYSHCSEGKTVLEIDSYFGTVLRREVYP